MAEARSSKGGAIRGIATFLLLVGITLTAIGYIFGKVVPPGSIGVRQYTMGPTQGFSEHVLRPGYHWSIPFYSKVHLVPLSVQIFDIHMSGGNDEASRSGGLDITTADGAYLTVDVSVVARFFDARAAEKDLVHGGPTDLIRKLGIDRSAWRRHILTVTADQLNRKLSELHAAQFYDPSKRDRKLREAENDIQQILSEYGVDVQGVLLRRYVYGDARIDQAIFDKNLQAQEEKFNEQAKLLSEAKAKLEQLAAEWDAKIETLRVEGVNTSKVLRSEGDLYEKTKVAEGDLKFSKAQAEVDKLRAGALAQASGDIFVAREMAPLLGSIRGGVVGDTDPYDLDEWLRKLGIVRGQPQ